MELIFFISSHDKTPRCIQEHDMLIERTIEVNVLSKISDERFCCMSANYEKEHKMLAAVEHDEQAVRKAEQEKMDLKLVLGDS